MRILCMNYEYPPIGGGGGAVCRGLAENLVRLGNEVDVVTSGMGDLPGHEVIGGVRVHRVSCYRRHRHYVSTPEMVTQVLPAYRHARRLARRSPYAINHTHFILPSGLSSYLLWRAIGLPYVVTIHGSDVPGYNPDRFRLEHALIRPLWRRIVGAASCVVSASCYLADLVRQYVNAEIEIVPHSINLPKPPDTPKQNRILVVTRMFERKGVQFLIRALENFSTDWEICVAGDGPYLDTLQVLARQLNVPVRFLGWVKGSALTELYQSARVFVFPSMQENSPVVLLEAMNAGCAVVTTTAAGCAEMVQGAAITVTPGSVAELRTALQRLLADDKDIVRLSRLGQERVAELSPSNVARTHEDIFARYAQ